MIELCSQAADLFNFPSYLPGWARTKRRRLPDPAHESSQQPPRLLALDCEMCETENERDALIGLCVVDEKGSVLYKVR
jgi:RNA exonuclease 1